MTTRRSRARRGAPSLKLVPDDPLPTPPPAYGAARHDVDPNRPPPVRIPRELLALLRSRREPGGTIDPDALNPFRPSHTSQKTPVPPGVIPEGAKIAMDTVGTTANAVAWASQAYYNSAFAEGTTFLGYAYLAILAQRPEYRVATEVIATEMIREWIKVRRVGHANPSDKPDERIVRIEEELKRLKVREAFHTCAEHDGFFGNGPLFLDFGEDPEDADGKTALALSVGDGNDEISRARCSPSHPLRRLRNIEPVWIYPNRYNSSNPLRDDWYRPETWFVLGTEIHSSRLLTMIGRPVPDMLKPAYAFGGLSMSQMMKPYVDNWLRTRQAVADLIASFAVMGLKTNLNAMLAPGSELLLNRLDLFNVTRDNNNAMMLDKETEDWFNVSTPLSTLDALQAQTQEHLASVTRIPLVKLLGIQPAGLNASSEGELSAFYDWIAAYQEFLFRDPLTRVLRFVQLSLFGEVDPNITFEFKPLMQLDEGELAENRRREAETAKVYADVGAVSADEIRRALAADESSPYAGLDLSGPAPGPPRLVPPPGAPPSPGAPPDPSAPVAGSTDLEPEELDADLDAPPGRWAAALAHLHDPDLPTWEHRATSLFADPDELGYWAGQARKLFNDPAPDRWQALAAKLALTSNGGEEEGTGPELWASRAAAVRITRAVEAIRARQRTADAAVEDRARFLLGAPRNVVPSPNVDTWVGQIDPSPPPPRLDVQPPPALLSQKTVLYEYPSLHGAARCQSCVYFRPSDLPKRCRFVDGLIEPEGWCTLFTARNGTNDTNRDNAKRIEGESLFRDLAFAADAAEGTWSEEKHPRDPKGKFAKAGMGHPSMISTLKKKGYEKHPSFPASEVWHHPETGHHVAFIPPTPTQHAQGKKSLTFKHLPPPGSPHKAQKFWTTGHLADLMTKLHPANTVPATANLSPPPGAPSSPLPAAPSKPTIGKTGLSLSPGQHGLATKSIGEGPDGGTQVKLANGVLSAYNDGSWYLSADLGQKSGVGQAELDAAFEALHPRGPGGQFIAKPGGPEPQAIPGTVFTVPADVEIQSLAGPNAWGVPYVKTASGHTLSLLKSPSTAVGVVDWSVAGPGIVGLKTGKGQAALNDFLHEAAATQPLPTAPDPQINPQLAFLPPELAKVASDLVANGGWTIGDKVLDGEAVLISPDKSHSVLIQDDGYWKMYDGDDLLAAGNGTVGLTVVLIDHTGYHLTASTSSPSTASPSAPPSLTLPGSVGAPIDPAVLTLVGPPKGSNPGGVYENPATGQRYYVKHTKSADHARNELLAARLYQLAGAPTLNYHPAGPNGVATDLIDLKVDDLTGLTPKQRADAQLDFATHAWLANWDAVGLQNDNIGANQQGQYLNLDLGGALQYRAQGAPKGAAFGTSATEWDTLRDPAKNATSAALFKSMTKAQLVESASRVAKVSNAQIESAVIAAGYEGPAAAQLIKKLIARRDDVINRSKAAPGAALGPPATGTAPAVPPKPQHPHGTAPNGQPAVAPSHSIDFFPQKYQKHLSWAPKPTQSHAQAIALYTGGSYKSWNKALRESFGQNPKGFEDYDSQLHDYFKNVSTPEPMTVRRRVDSNFAKHLIDEAISGEHTPGSHLYEFTDHGWASSDHWSGKLTMEIHVPKGSRAVAVGQYSVNPIENEILIEAGSRYRIDHYDPKTQTMKVTLIRSGRAKDGVVHGNV